MGSNFKLHRLLLFFVFLLLSTSCIHFLSELKCITVIYLAALLSSLGSMSVHYFTQALLPPFSSIPFFVFQLYDFTIYQLLSSEDIHVNHALKAWMGHFQRALSKSKKHCLPVIGQLLAWCTVAITWARGKQPCTTCENTDSLFPLKHSLQCLLWICHFFLICYSNGSLIILRKWHHDSYLYKGMLV